jgi:MFS family permease
MKCDDMLETNQVGFGTAEKHFAILTLLINSLTWFYITWMSIETVLRGLQEATAQVFIVRAVYYITIVGSGILGSILSKRLRNQRFFCFWTLLGVLSSLLLIWFDGTSVVNTSLISLFWGFAFGLGMPALLASFADCTDVENRGRTAGIIFLAINLLAPVFAVLVQPFELTMRSLISAAWRGSALLLVFYSKTPTRTVETRKAFSFSSIFQHKAFMLYFVAWLLFCFVDNFETPVLSGFLEAEFYSLMLMVEAVVGSIFGLVGGWLCDLIGRKRVVIYGFVALGLAYAVISIVPTTICWYVYFVVDGFSAGMLWVAFFFVLWGDLSQHGGREKYYAIGSIPYFLTPLIQDIIAPFAMLPTYFAFSLASFFLFVAVLPLMYAPETLPDRKIELRKLRKYVEKAREAKEKHEEG